MELIQKEIKRNVYYAFREFNRELLPEEIRNERSVDWVLRFDALEKQQYRSEEYDRYRYGDRDDIAPFVAQMIQQLLTPIASFYFASLFHIGRQWQVSEQVIKSVERAMHSDNLEKTVTLNIPLLQEQLMKLDINTGDYKSVLSDSFTQILELAKQKKIEEKMKAQEWWRLWKNEVRELMEVVDRCTREYYDRGYDRDRFRNRMGIPSSIMRLMTFSFEMKDLFNSMSKYGVKFKNVTQHQSGHSIQSILMQPFLLMLFQSGMDESFGFHFRDILHEYNKIIKNERDLIKEKIDAPIIEQAKSQLVKIFESNNLFDKYNILESPPDFQLKKLWNKCILPNEEMFYYANNWKNSLEPQPSFKSWSDCKELTFKSKLSDTDIESYARSADSTIKRYWVEQSNDKAQSDAELCQYLFDKEWMFKMVEGAVCPTRQKKGKQKWDMDIFRNMIEKVINILNIRVGYTLETPNTNRLKKLWDLALKGKTLESDD